MSAPQTDAGDRPRLSVLLPTHNGERWLAITLGSLVAQTRKDFECVLIDSSPTDATRIIAEGFRDRLDLRVAHRPDILDWQGKTNLAAEMARAEHVCMLHQDDVWEPYRAETVARWLAEAPGTTLHLHPSWIIDDRGRRLGLLRCPLPTGPDLTGAAFCDKLIVQNFVSICAPVMRRDAFLAVGGLDRALWYTADWDLYLRLGRSGGVAYHPEPLTGYRVHGQALTVTGSRQPQDFEAQMTMVLERHRGGIAAATLSRARASIAVNTALAAALHTGPRALMRAAWAIAALGPFGIVALLRETRLFERLMPRLRAHLAGRLAS